MSQRRQQHDLAALTEAAPHAYLTRHFGEVNVRTQPGQLERIICHLDVQSSNVHTTSEDFTLLDWDDAGPSSPGWELAAILPRWFASDGALHLEAPVRTTKILPRGGWPWPIDQHIHRHARDHQHELQGGSDETRLRSGSRPGTS
ncbi:phosphotransferase [Nonomuraea sp. NPDC049714]|uniref:phosphotransferase n=1 Tax=Nonomuraea sp. NPDC049714 TaxID=3364357 RepID=UPI0037A4E0B5